MVPKLAAGRPDVRRAGFWRHQNRFSGKIDLVKINPKAHMGVSKNRGTPKSSILIGFFIINHPFWGFSPYFWKHPHTKKPTIRHFPKSEVFLLRQLEPDALRWCGKTGGSGMIWAFLGYVWPNFTPWTAAGDHALRDLEPFCTSEQYVYT